MSEPHATIREMTARTVFRGPFAIRDGATTSRLVLADGVIAAELWDPVSESWQPADAGVLLETFDWRTRRLSPSETAALGIPAADCAPWP